MIKKNGNFPKAYKNRDFLSSTDARPLRILSEYIEPRERFNRYNVTDTVVFFGSARTLPVQQAQDGLAKAEAGGDPSEIRLWRANARVAKYYDDARELARLLTEWSKGLELPEKRFIVCSGGGPGIMEAANRGASEAAGISIGLGISLPMEATANDYITRELGFEFHYFFMRKFWFVYLAKAMAVFPGGFGTFDELFELLTLVQTQKIGKRLPIVLYGKEFWNDVFNFEALVEWGTISPEDLDLFHIASTPQDAFEFLRDGLTEAYLSAPGEGD